MTDNSDSFADDMAEYLPTFLDETDEQLDDLVETLLVLENDANNHEALNESFRLIHSIKGSAGIMGFENITVLTHHLEDRFEQFRSGRAKLDESTMNLVLRCIDFLRHCSNLLRSGQPLGTSTDLLQELKMFEDQPESAPTPEAHSPVDVPANLEINEQELPASESVEDESVEDESLVRMKVQFRPKLQLVDLKAQLIVSRLSALGEVRFTQPNLDQIAELERLETFVILIETNEEFSRIRSAAEVDGVESIELGSEEADRNNRIASGQTREQSAPSKPEIVAKPMEDEPDETDEPPIVELSTNGDDCEEQIERLDSRSDSELPGASLADRSGERDAPVEKIAETMRVEIDRLDNLMNLAGELVVNRARFEQISAEVNPELRKANMLNRIREFSDCLRMMIEDLSKANGTEPDWSPQIKQLRNGLDLMDEQSEIWSNGRNYVNQMGEAIDQLSRVSHGLRRGVLGTRMVPVAPLFNRFKRVVRDLSKERGKQVGLVIQGEKTELDKRMIDELGDPLVHLVRNSIDHGLETMDVRIDRGKTETGTIFLEANHRGNNIYISVRDDGQGIDAEKIRSKLIDKQILSKSAAGELTREQLLDYIWHAGFSTAREVTDVSGRGVGMDVVRTRINQLNGTVHVESTQGEGTTFTIRLPLTLAIITSLLVRLRDVTISLPIDDVREIVSIQEQKIVSVLGKKTIDVRGEFIPLLNVDEIFHWHGIDYVGHRTTSLEQNDSSQEKVNIVVLSAAGKTIGLRVDELLGSQDLVIKSLSDNFMNLRGLSGASILGDGSVCLMLEVGTVIEMAIRPS